MQNKCYIILIYSSSTGSIFKKLQYVFCRKSQKFDAIKTQGFFTDVSFVFTNNAVITKYLLSHSFSEATIPLQKE